MSVDPQYIRVGAPGAPETRAHCHLCQAVYTIADGRAATGADLAQLATEHTCDDSPEPVWTET